MSGPPPPAAPPPGGPEPDPPPRDAGPGPLRWAAFCGVLVPVALLWCGASLAGAAGTALGLAAVTFACRFLLRRAERHATRPGGEGGPGDAGDGGPAGPIPGARGGVPHTGESTPVA
ncbi:hypothetical protein VM636_19770 [Streptomyces sp. SCSIO 75703]|uniref:hypothetical protein n=1 Tax=unclassified Streptomyces TaxID=2593676 RepID=UPI00099CA342|nr:MULTISPECIES: hypothetical protein [unclassified Streptomyces]